MNMRLIDADKLIAGRVEDDPVVIAGNAASTAYDVNKVAEQLEGMLGNDFEYRYKRCRTVGDDCCVKHIACEYCILQGAIEIVKAGGKDE